MSFSAEMKDFFAAFQATSSVAGDINERKLKKKKLEQDREYGIDDWDNDWKGHFGLDYEPAGKTSKTEVVTSETEEPEEEAALPVDGDDDIEVGPVMEPGAGTYYPPGAQKVAPPPMNYAAGGTVKGLKIGTQPGRLAVDMSKMNKDLLKKWEKTQQDFGKEFNIVSAYRSPKRNKKAGGAKKSQHMHGNAIDIDVSGLSKAERLDLIKTASANGFTGIGVYNNSLHFDVGGRRAWGPSYKSDSIPGWAKDTIGQHLGGKIGGSRPKTTPNREPEYESATGPTSTPNKRTASALPIAAEPAEGYETAEEPSWRDRFRERMAYGEEAASYMPQEEETNNSALDAFYNNEGIDISAIDVPEPRPYTPVPMSAVPSPMGFADGGTVPWANETGYVAARPNAGGGSPMGRYFQRRPYVPRSGSGSYTDPLKKEASTYPKYPWADSMEYILKYQSSYPAAYVNRVDKMFPYEEGNNGINMLRNKMAFTPAGSLIMSAGGTRKAYAEGGLVEGEPEEEQAIHEEEIAATRPAPRPAPAIPENAVPARPQGKVTLGQAIDLGLKHLSGALGLDRSGAAVGADPDLRKRRAALVRGDIAENEPPPAPEEMEQVFRTVDPDGKLDDSLRTIYAMRKGVEFYLKKGDPQKAGKWAGALIQFSNLVSRQYGMEAVKAGRAGDTETMVQLAVKSYDAIPDGMNVSAKLNEGAVAVTRTDEEGNVIDTHRLTPQQVFQMATGISKGSGYFEALMNVADPTGKKGGTSGTNATDRRNAITTEGNASLISDYAKYLKPGEVKAWETAVKTNNVTLQNTLLARAMKRAEEEEKNVGKSEGADARKEAVRVRFRGLTEFASEEDAEALELALEAGDFQQANDIIRDVAAARPKPEKPTPADKVAERQEKSNTRKVNIYSKLFPKVKGAMTPEDIEAWNAAVEENDGEELKNLYKSVVDQMTDAQKEAARKSEKEADAAARKAEKEADREVRKGERAEDRKAISDRMDKSDALIRGRADDEKAAKAKKEAEDLARANAEVSDLDMLYEEYLPFFTPAQQAQWDIGRKNNDPKRIIKVLDAIDQSGMGPGSAEDAALEEDGGGENWTVRLGKWMATPWSERGYGPKEEAIPTSPAPAPAPAPAVTPESNAGKPMTPEVLARAKQAIAEGRSRAGVIQKLREAGYNPAGL